MLFIRDDYPRVISKTYAIGFWPHLAYGEMTSQRSSERHYDNTKKDFNHRR